MNPPTATESAAESAERKRPRELYRQATRAALLGLVANAALGAVKLAGGALAGSIALIADGVNSFGDALASIVVLVALWIAQHPADDEHPYGHARAEAIAASNVALLIILSALWIVWQAASRWRVAHSTPPAWALLIAGSNVVIKELLYQYKVRVGKRTGSTAIIANAWDHRSDALCALAVLIGLAVIRLGGPDYLWADEAASIIVAAAILWSGFQLFRRAGSELMDEQADGEFVQAIRRTALAVDGVRDIETLLVRKSGLEFFVDVHIEVDPQLTVAEGHRIGHVVKDKLLREFPVIRDILVHLEPHGEP